MHTKLERLLSKSLTTLEVMTYYLVVHTGPGTKSAILLRPEMPGDDNDDDSDNNNDNDSIMNNDNHCICTVPFHAKHAQLRCTSTHTQM